MCKEAKDTFTPNSLHRKFTVVQTECSACNDDEGTPFIGITGRNGLVAFGNMKLLRKDGSTIIPATNKFGLLSHLS